MAEPFYSDDRTKTALDGTVRILKTATHQWIVQQLVGTTWYYADSPFWLALTPAQFADIQAVYAALKSPSPSIESFL
jgi:hypothetical protein